MNSKIPRDSRALPGCANEPIVRGFPAETWLETPNGLKRWRKLSGAVRKVNRGIVPDLSRPDPD